MVKILRTIDKAFLRSLNQKQRKCYLPIGMTVGYQGDIIKIVGYCSETGQIEIYRLKDNVKQRLNFDCGDVYVLEEAPTNSSSPTTLMGKFSEFIKRATMTDDQKVLKDSGLEDPVGVPTQEGKDALQQLLWDENKTKLVAQAKEMLAEEEKAKSKK